MKNSINNENDVIQIIYNKVAREIFDDADSYKSFHTILNKIDGYHRNESIHNRIYNTLNEAFETEEISFYIEDEFPECNIYEFLSAEQIRSLTPEMYIKFVNMDANITYPPEIAKKFINTVQQSNTSMPTDIEYALAMHKTIASFLTESQDERRYIDDNTIDSLLTLQQRICKELCEYYQKNGLSMYTADYINIPDYICIKNSGHEHLQCFFLIEDALRILPDMSELAEYHDENEASIIFSKQAPCVYELNASNVAFSYSKDSVFPVHGDIQLSDVKRVAILRENINKGSDNIQWEANSPEQLRQAVQDECKIRAISMTGCLWNSTEVYIDFWSDYSYMAYDQRIGLGPLANEVILSLPCKYGEQDKAIEAFVTQYKQSSGTEKQRIIDGLEKAMDTLQNPPSMSAEQVFQATTYKMLEEFDAENDQRLQAYIASHYAHLPDDLRMKATDIHNSKIGEFISNIAYQYAPLEYAIIATAQTLDEILPFIQQQCAEHLNETVRQLNEVMNTSIELGISGDTPHTMMVPASSYASFRQKEEDLLNDEECCYDHYYDDDDIIDGWE